MASNDLRDAAKAAADVVVRYVKDAATLTVKTQLQQVGGAAPVAAAETTLRLDGDSTSILPARLGESGNLEVDPAVHELHMQAVNSAIEYRARILQAMFSLLQR